MQIHQTLALSSVAVPAALLFLERKVANRHFALSAQVFDDVSVQMIDLDAPRVLTFNVDISMIDVHVASGNPLV